MKPHIHSITRSGEHEYEVIFDVGGVRTSTVCSVSRHQGFAIVSSSRPEVVDGVGIFSRLIFAAVTAMDDAVGGDQ